MDNLIWFKDPIETEIYVKPGRVIDERNKDEYKRI